MKKSQMTIKKNENIIVSDNGVLYITYRWFKRVVYAYGIIIIDKVPHINDDHRHLLKIRDLVEVDDKYLIVQNHTMRGFEHTCVINMLDF